jgi:hypothetical protein
MGITAAIIGGIGGLCAVMGIVTALGVVDLVMLMPQLTWNFWFSLSVIFLLAAIAFALGRSYE